MKNFAFWNKSHVTKFSITKATFSFTGKMSLGWMGNTLTSNGRNQYIHIYFLESEVSRLLSKYWYFSYTKTFEHVLLGITFTFINNNFKQLIRALISPKWLFCIITHLHTSTSDEIVLGKSRHKCSKQQSRSWNHFKEFRVPKTLASPYLNP